MVEMDRQEACDLIFLHTGDTNFHTYHGKSHEFLFFRSDHISYFITLG